MSFLISCVLLSQAEEYVNLSEGAQTALKWRFLLERCKIYLKVGRKPMMSYSTTLIYEHHVVTLN